MIAPGRLVDEGLLRLNGLTHRTFALPLLVFYATAGCNSRCITCDWWHASSASDLSTAEVGALAAELPALRTRRVLFSGGEPLLRGDVFEMATLFRARGARLDLLTNGLLFERYAEQVAAHFDTVTLSLDADTPELYRQVRGVDGLEQVERGMARLLQVAPRLPVRARCTLQRHNFRRLPILIDKARSLGLAQISFLAADVSGDAFGRPRARDGTGAETMAEHSAHALPDDLLPNAEEVAEFARLVDDTIRTHAPDFASGFVAESAQKLRRLPQYYAARLGLAALPPVACNAPWISAVIEADGAVRPCFFQRAVGDLRDKPLHQILNGEMVAFRAGLQVHENAVCATCVCALNMNLRTPL
jgi:MoaA/NifB/PqqE/SkfB family radical SAM enzyme